MTADQCRRWRTRYGFSLRQLARQMNYNYRTIHRWERGEYAMPIKAASKLAMVFWAAAAQERATQDAGAGNSATLPPPGQAHQTGRPVPPE